jgi:hypothetical protein
MTRPPSEYDTAIYKQARAELLRDKPLCHWCRRNIATELDHLVEHDKGGTIADGIVPACKPCNSSRGATHRNRKLANAKQQRETALNGFLYGTDTPPSPNLHFVATSPNQPELEPISHDRPRLETIVPEHSGSLAEAVGGLAKAVLGIDLMPWQRHCLNGILAIDDDSLFVHRTSLVSVARQNGKTTIIQALILYWLVEMPKIRGQKQTVVSGAHRLDLACLLFDDLAPILEDFYGAKIVKSYGRYQATMPDGSKWWVKALKPNQGHGMSIDLVVVDELFDVNPESVEGGLLPAQRARKNPLACFFSTAGTEESVLFQRWREAGIRAIDKGEPSSMYMAEWSPPPHADPLAGPATWAWGNPALGHTLDMDTIRQESTNPDRASFLRASLNLWVSVVRGWIEPNRWPQLHYTGDIPSGGIVSVEASLDESRYSATRVVHLPDGRILVTVAFVAETVTELWQKINDYAKDPQVKFAFSPTVDATCPPALERRRIVVGYAELGRFTPLAKNLIQEGRLVHTGEELLAEHVQRAVAVRTDNTIVLSSKRSPGPIELARTMVWGVGIIARPNQTGKPMLVAITN